MTAIAAPVQKAEPIEVAIREASPDELRWVQATWARGIRVTARELLGRRLVPIGRRSDGVLIDGALWMRAHHMLVDALLPASTVIVATLPDMPDTPCAWAAFEGSTLHYVFVAPVARRSTIATQLVLHTRCSSVSHMTDEGVGLMRHLRGEAEA